MGAGEGQGVARKRCLGPCGAQTFLVWPPRPSTGPDGTQDGDAHGPRTRQLSQSPALPAFLSGARGAIPRGCTVRGPVPSPAWLSRQLPGGDAASREPQRGQGVRDKKRKTSIPNQGGEAGQGTQKSDAGHTHRHTRHEYGRDSRTPGPAGKRTQGLNPPHPALSHVSQVTSNHSRPQSSWYGFQYTDGD